MNRRRIALVALGLVVAVAFAACSSKSKSPTNPGGGGGGTGPSFTFSFPSVGSSSSQVFADAGTFTYKCIAHQSLGMTGTVVVATSSTTDSALVQVGPGSSLTFSPSTVTIKMGGLVRWVNGTSSLPNHTASR